MTTTETTLNETASAVYRALAKRVNKQDPRVQDAALDLQHRISLVVNSIKAGDREIPRDALHVLDALWLEAARPMTSVELAFSEVSTQVWSAFCAAAGAAIDENPADADEADDEPPLFCDRCGVELDPENVGDFDQAWCAMCVMIPEDEIAPVRVDMTSVADVREWFVWLALNGGVPHPDDSAYDLDEMKRLVSGPLFDGRDDLALIRYDRAMTAAREILTRAGEDIYSVAMQADEAAEKAAAR